MAILDFLEIKKGPGPPSTSSYVDGQILEIVQKYVFITNIEGVMGILMIS